MELFFLGTNGWYSTKTGNTSCILLKTPDRYIVLDAGDGIYKLDEFITNNNPIDIFLSHFHLDHIYGFHIQPKFHLKNKITIYGQKNTKKILKFFINKPFTAPTKLLEKKFGLSISIKELKVGQNFLEGYNVVVRPLVHADPTIGFRFVLNENNKTKIVSYCTDSGPTKNIVFLAKNADVLITECSLLAEEKINPFWPHLNPQTAAKIAKEAKVKKLLLSHFAAHKYKTKLDRLKALKTAKKIFPNTLAAFDGLRLKF
ncbi:MAG: MBL fold metallo-hydrolase [Candidatus Micrarchaeota archaeon]|nr:MBL fold metallo-hydrolase [Candidatus Micrarchaeota archaeon]